MAEDAGLELKWSKGLSLTWRILAINFLVVALIGGSFFYLDSIRNRLIEQRADEVTVQTRLIADALSDQPELDNPQILKMAMNSRMRLRIFSADGKLEVDSWTLAEPNFSLRDPEQEGWRKQAARALDSVVDTVVFAEIPPLYVEPNPDIASAWPEIISARTGKFESPTIRLAPDRTAVMTSAAPLPNGRSLLTLTNAREVTRAVRAERLRLGLAMIVAILISALLSYFLARTIVRPLRHLAHAAVRVKQGRARDVTVPRLPFRRDEIGLLARSLSDMTNALRVRIDATEAFAADVTHELKNPLASLSSAVETLGQVKDAKLRKQLLAVIHSDVRRLDRLVTEIAEASRLDAHLSKAKFESIDLGRLIQDMLKQREKSSTPYPVPVAFARPRSGAAVVRGVEAQLARVMSNLIDNAVSFSPSGGLVQVRANRDGDNVMISIEDEGPGVPPELREDIFRRFHSVRPGEEEFGKHSGLGLAIARAIVDGHDGTITASERLDGKPGARFVVLIPLDEALRDNPVF